MQPRLIHLSGEPHAMGRKYGEQLREEIHALAEERLRLSMAEARLRGRRVSREECLALAGRFLPAHQAYDPAVYAEFQGIAEGAGISPELLLIGNGYTDYKDVLVRGASAAECTAFWVRPEAAGGRTLCGQTWDMHASAEAFVVLVHRRPAEGPATLSLTTAGCLSLIGVNAWGLALGNNNLVPTDSRPGVVYLAMIHRALNSPTWEEAVAAITDAPRASGHNYYLCDAAGRACDIETTATQAAVLSPEGPTFVHTNHYTAPKVRDLAAPPEPGATSPHRERRLKELFTQAPRPFSPESIRGLLADHEGGVNSVCVHNTLHDGSKSCGVAILCPQTRELWARVGNPCEGELYRFALDEI